jgi:hypothetical protein
MLSNDTYYVVSQRLLYSNKARFALASWCCVHSEKSGHGVLEFSTDKAGQDVTPLNLEFGDEDRQQHKASGGALNSITGMFCTPQSCGMCLHCCQKQRKTLQ